MNFDSPSAAAALGVLPSLGDLGLDGTTGGLVMPVVGGLHGLGARSDEDEKRKKLQQVIDILKVRVGIYSRRETGNY
jgi:hypothetical protein